MKTQKIEEIDNSTVLQAGGDIHVGISYTDVKDICQTLIAAEVTRLTQEAKEEFAVKLEEFEHRFHEKLSDITDKKIVEKLKTPSVQLCLHGAVLSAMKTDNDLTKEQLYEMLIDRLKVNEHDTEKAIIEDAIETAPKVSAPLMALMVALQFITYSMVGVYQPSMEKLFAKAGSLFDALDNLTNLDVAYGTQLKCLDKGSIYVSDKGYEDFLLRNYDLFFRHNIKYGQYKQFCATHPEIELPVKLNDILETSIICIDASKEENENNYEVFIVASSSIYLKSKLMQQGKENMIPVLEELLQQMPPFTKEELKRYLLGLNPGWAKVFQTFTTFTVNNLRLTPVGNYLTLVHTRNITHQSTDFLKKMY